MIRLAFGVAVVLLLVGCGGSGDGADPVRRAVDDRGRDDHHCGWGVADGTDGGTVDDRGRDDHDSGSRRAASRIGGPGGLGDQRRWAGGRRAGR